MFSAKVVLLISWWKPVLMYSSSRCGLRGSLTVEKQALQIEYKVKEVILKIST